MSITASATHPAVRNPLPAQGGVDPESIETVRQRAPYAFRTQERAVTPEDYAARNGPTPRSAAGRGDPALDGELAHGLCDGGSAGRPGR